jgi:sporulation protein YlmC with PRC-barrel domain
MNRTLEDLRLADVEGSRVLDRAGDELGTVEDLYYDDADRTPRWVLVNRGRRTTPVLVPLSGGETRDGALVVPYERSVVDDAPEVDGGERLGRDDEQRLLEHYRAATTVRTGSTGRAGSGRRFRTVDVPNELVTIRVVDVPHDDSGTIRLNRQDVEIERRPWQDGDHHRQPAPPGVVEIVLTREEIEEDHEGHD